MKKIISILSSLLIGNTVPLNITLYSASLNSSPNTSYTKISESSSSYDLSILNKYTNNDLKKWRTNGITTSNLNLDYLTIQEQMQLLPTSTQAVYFCISALIDKKYNDQEINNFQEYAVLQRMAANPNYQKLIYFTILDKKNSVEPLNKNNGIFHNLNVQQNNISSFYLRISNNPSMDWNTNKSYLDITINICNFGNKKLHNLITTKNNQNLANKLQQFNTKDSWNQINSGLTYNIHSTKGIDIKLTDICPQFTNLKIANYFLDYSAFSFNPHSWLHTQNYGNHDINPNHNDPNANQKYYFNLNTLKQDWAKEDSAITSSQHTYSAISKDDTSSQYPLKLPKVTDRFHYFFSQFVGGKCYVTSYTHISNKNYNNNPTKTLNNTDDFQIEIFTSSHLVGKRAWASWNFGSDIINTNLEFHINKEIFGNDEMI